MENIHELDVTLKELEFGNIKITDDIVQTKLLKQS